MKVHCNGVSSLVKISELKPHPRNRNRHPQSQIKRLADILNYQGFRYPVKVSTRSGYVTSGHGRIEAAKLNGWTEVPVQYQYYESDEQEYADLIADNGIAGWAELDLAEINMDMVDLGPDFQIDYLGIERFVIDPIDLTPLKEETQEKHRNVSPVQCPNCGEQFLPRSFEEI